MIPLKIDRTKRVQALCVQGHAELHPTAKVKLRIEGNVEEKDIVVAPRFPTAVLIGRDITGQNKAVTNNAFTDLTRSQAKRTAPEESDADKSKGAVIQEPRQEVDGDEQAGGKPTVEALQPQECARES